ncbi:hypothetical protein RND71_028531 [Anisodus tanguticus]|uniref:Uncharacterized protein n=1 Tax=Anisodus tanguticus TaxID=243964 RepID=A0AAE1RLE0_9SOLA|nr:hypothetical protein RND71_028531 [Anisodus tanguticus]
MRSNSFPVPRANTINEPRDTYVEKHVEKIKNSKDLIISGPAQFEEFRASSSFNAYSSFDLFELEIQASSLRELELMEGTLSQLEADDETNHARHPIDIYIPKLIFSELLGLYEPNSDNWSTPYSGNNKSAKTRINGWNVVV